MYRQALPEFIIELSDSVKAAETKKAILDPNSKNSGGLGKLERLINIFRTSSALAESVINASISQVCN